MSLPIIIAISIASIAVGFFVGYIVRQLVVRKRKNSIEAKVQKFVEDSKQEAKEIIFKAKNNASEFLQEARNEIRDRETQVRKTEERVQSREVFLDKKLNDLDVKNKDAEEKIEKATGLKRELETEKEKISKELERIAMLSREEAQKELFRKIEQNHADDLMLRLRKLETTGIEDLERRAKNILSTVIQRLATSTASEVTTTVVAIPNDDIKGKIIGREGRNIRALERAAGVEIIVDDTPGAVVISGFDPVRRQIARAALEILVVDGRIQPARIEEVVAKSKAEMEKQLKSIGEAAAYESGIFNLDPKLLHLIGRLKFRTSYGQNVLMHSMEMVHISGMLAEELGGDIRIAKFGALVHDIGKAVDHEIQGTHVEIGRRILAKFGVEKPVIQAMQSHHEEYPYETLESIIVQTADAISASRPGARRDSVENYLRRLQELEAITNSFEGVEKSYAIQAGREIRVFVTPEKISDLEARTLARDIALKIEQDLKYPGEIKVNVIREMRAIEYAR
ncbi:MAG: ribonuclease Y [Patescibacteria group bacterium]